MSSKPDGLWKSTIVIWSEFDPHNLELSQLAIEAETGEAYCERMDATYVPQKDLDSSMSPASLEWFINEVF